MFINANVRRGLKIGAGVGVAIAVLIVVGIIIGVVLFKKRKSESFGSSGSGSRSAGGDNL